MEHVAKIVNGQRPLTIFAKCQKPLTIFAKCSILEVCRVSEYVSDSYDYYDCGPPE